MFLFACFSLHVSLCTFLFAGPNDEGAGEYSNQKFYKKFFVPVDSLRLVQGKAGAGRR